MPSPTAAERYRHLQRIWRTVRAAEDRHQVQLCRELEDGFAGSLYRWAQGEPLEDVLRDSEMSPGDFVRTCKQVLDLLRQIEQVAPERSAGAVRLAREAVNRGVVAYTGV
jgi:ATP-dependent RNA helicase HelY